MSQLQKVRTKMNELESKKPAENYNAGAPFPAWSERMRALEAKERALKSKLYDL